MEGQLQQGRWLQPVSLIAWLVVLVLLALTPANTKMGGVLWLMLVVWGGWVWLRDRRSHGEPGDEGAWRVARVWLGFCLAGVAFKLAGVLYWDDPIGTRHFEMRVGLSACAVYLLVRSVRPRGVDADALRWTLLAAAVVGLAVSGAHAYWGVETPSNRINWAGGLVMFAFVQIALLRLGASGRELGVMAGSAALFLLSVLLTGARGAYLVVPWLVISVFWGAWLCSARPWSQRLLSAIKLAMLVVALSSVVAVLLPKVVEVPLQRLDMAVDEAVATLAGDRDANYVNSSVGVRLQFWQHAVRAIQEQPWLGYGRAQRIAFIQAWADEVGSEEMKRQIHVHSEYLNGMLDHGVLGLMSTLSFMAAFLVSAWVARRWNRFAAIGLLGLGVLHVLMSITDTNTGTNNYGVMMSLSVAMILLARPGMGIRGTSS